MLDFTYAKYFQLLNSLKAQKYNFQTFENYIKQAKTKSIVLRHDVDRTPGNSKVIALIENDFGIQTSYYFRIVKESYDENIIKQIAELGHEIGYHYEDLSLCNGDYESAIKHFELNLEKFRKIYPVKTICMHGSPLSKWDNRDLWKKYNYRDFGIIAEPYIDIDYTQVFYVTDTGRKWNIKSSSVRDKVNSGFHILIESTQHFIELAEKNELPAKIMLNVHPQRWFDFGVGWVKELVGQNVKNIAKTAIIRLRK